MYDAVSPSGRRIRRRSPPRGRVLLRTTAVALLCGLFSHLTGPEAPVPHGAAPAARVRAAAIQPGPHAWMLDPNPALGAGARGLEQAGPLGTALARPVTPAAPPTILARAAPRVTAPEPERVAQRVPLPVPRPAGLLAQAEPARLTPRTAPALRSLAVRRTQIARATSDAEAERSFFDTVFGTRSEPETPPTTLAYASADPRRTPERDPGSSAGTAVYDITAQTVTLPSGERLEAHSGLGEAQDNPRHVHRRMRGATPPGTYDLTEREALFHGVRAIRLNPVGGSAAIHGRDGILAHTYMLGPSGASNGCVVFRDYNRFLQAFLRGEVRRMVVVAGGRGGVAPSFAENLFGRATR